MLIYQHLLLPQQRHKLLLKMMEMRIPSIGKNLLKFIEGQKRPSRAIPVDKSIKVDLSTPLSWCFTIRYWYLRNTLNRGIISRRMSHRMVATIMIWVTWLLRKQIYQCRGSKKVVGGVCFSESPYTKWRNSQKQENLSLPQKWRQKDLPFSSNQ